MMMMMMMMIRYDTMQGAPQQKGRDNGALGWKT
jgi:hypothetical protein